MSELNLNKDDKNILLKLARNTLQEYLTSPTSFTEDKVIKDITITDGLDEKLGAFVTLKIGDNLRGCIGYVEGIMPLYKAVIDNTINASTKDPRFRPMTFDEEKDVHIEISVMSALKKITDYNLIEVGKHGIIIRSAYNSGLLLPQVATEWNWDREEFLSHTCEKAGLPMDAWKDNSIDIFIFSAIVFGE
ncbi:MAG: AmmeMemoRadiSam system protein A [Pseudomonadota bacterium]